MANPFIGRLITLGIAKEAVRGTGAVPLYFLPHTDISFDPKSEKALSMEALGKIEDADESYTMSRWGEGDIQGHLRDGSFGLFLYALLGSVSSLNTDGAAYTHTFSLVQNNQHQSLAIVVNNTIQAEMFRLAMINSLSIDANLGEFVNYAAGFMSKVGVDTSWSGVASTENRFVARHVRIKIASNLAGLDAASELDLKSANITVNKNVTRDHVLGTYDPDDIFNQQFGAEGSVSLNLTDDTYKDFMLNNSYRAMRIEFINNDVTIGTTTNPTIQINMPRVHFFDWESERPLDEITTQTINFKALSDLAGGNALISSIVLKNTVVSY